MNIEKIYKAIDKLDYISFDIFDTLIKRNVSHPSMIFDIVEQKFDIIVNKKSNFAKKRRIAEHDARKKYETVNNEEVTLDIIYRELEALFSKKELELLKSIELETELKYCQKNNDLYIQDIYNYSVKCGKALITSDMYLPEKFVKKLLNKCNIKGYKKIYLSSSLMLRKSTGNLFDYIKKELHTDKILHIGDNRISDYINPRKNKLKSIYYKKFNPTFFDRALKCIKKKLHIYKEETIELQKINHFIKNNMPTGLDIDERFGYECFGPLLLSFCKYLKIKREEDKINTLFFLSRDGWIIKKCYDTMYQDNTVYLFMSRRCSFVPYLHKTKSMEEILEKVISLPSYDGHISISQFLKVIGYNDSKIFERFLRSSIDINKIMSYEEFVKNRKIMKVLGSIYNNVCLYSKCEYINLKKYLEKNNFFDNPGIVDIGFHCTIQNYIQLLFKKKINGYYLGTRSKYELKNVNSYLFSPNKNQRLNVAILHYFSLFESLFLAQHGSTICIDNNLKPRFKEYEMLKESEIVRNVQNGALMFVKDCKKHNMIDEFNLSETDSMKKMNDQLLFPSRKLAKRLGSIVYSDKEQNYIAKPRKFYVYFNVKNLLKDIKLSSWNEGFVVNLFGIKMPGFIVKLFSNYYYKIYNISRKDLK